MHFNFDIEHIPGINNVVADALSRLVKVSQHYLSESSFDEEEGDEMLYIISEGTLNEIPYFRLEDDIYKRLMRVHNSTVGHVGVEKMISRLKNMKTSWRKMRMDCKKFIYQCASCQKMSALKYPIHIHPFTKAYYSPMNRVAIDTIGPLPEDGLGNKYIITIIDSFTRLVELIPSKDTGAISAANALIQWICRYGIPSQIVCDNGTQYANELIETLCTMFHIEQSLIQAYSHEENAIVERANKEVGRHLTAIVQDHKVIGQWSPMVPLVQRIMNSQVHQSIGVSPLQLMHGNAIDVDRMLFCIEDVSSMREEVHSMNDLRYRE